MASSSWSVERSCCQCLAPDLGSCGVRLADFACSSAKGDKVRGAAIARALAGEPKVLLMDEPTGNLDETTADQVLAMLVELSKKTGTTLVIVTHDRRVAAQTDQQFELHHGQLRSA